MIIRPRVEADFDALERIGDLVFEHDGYPGEPIRRRFLDSDDVLGAWVAELDGRVIGHVALHGSSLPVVMARAAEHLGHDRLAVVARLFTDPTTRRSGAGRALLDHAAADARARGLHPILDVVDRYAPARALYASAGWTDLGAVQMVFPRFELASHVYVAP